MNDLAVVAACRNAARSSDTPDSVAGDVGFRIAVVR